MISYLLLIVAILPLLFYMVDGYYEKNISKGVNTILLFLGLTTVTVFLTIIFKLYFVISVPLIIILYLVVSSILRKKS